MNTYRLGFERDLEAAAFVAALSRFLNSPAWEAGDPNLPLSEIWIDRNDPSGVAVYLNETTYRAAATAFGPFPPPDTGVLPASAEIILRGVQPPAWGREQAGRQLAGPWQPAAQ